MFASSNPTATYVMASSYAANAVPSNCIAPSSFGACARQDCSFPAPTPAPTLDAGVVTVGNSAATVQLDYLAGSYGGHSSQLLWSGGASITAAGGGPDVPGFSLSVTVPTAGVMTAPVYASTAPYQPLSTSVPLTVSWSATAADEVQVLLLGESSTAYSEVVCTVPASSGQVLIPSAAMAGMSGLTGLLDVNAIGKASSVQGSLEIDFYAEVFLGMPMGGAASVSVAFE